MARKRLVRYRMKSKKKKALSLDINSLLDILVILLVFLLKNYNSAEVIVNIPPNIKLPSSQSRIISTKGVMVQVSSDTIWVDDKEILNSKHSQSKIYDQDGKRIIALYNELVSKKETFQALEKASDGAQKFTGNINLIVDKKVQYSYLKKLMYTAATAGFKQYKFVVLGDES